MNGEGWKVKRTRIFLADDGSPDLTLTFNPEVWYISSKVRENPLQIEFSLRSPLEVESINLPRRQISRFCSWDWRSSECTYPAAGVLATDDYTGAADLCPKTLDACIARHIRSTYGKSKAEQEPLPFGGFPSVR